MNLQELKDIIQRDGGKIIIVENDKPELVVMSFEEYRVKIKGQQSQTRQESIPKQNSFVQPAPSRVDPVQKDEERERSDLTIDDLPLS